MSGHVLRFEGSAHSEAERLLPWFVNATLEGDELARVESHLAQCALCQREVEQLREMRNVGAEAPPPPDATAAFQRLLPRLQATRVPRLQATRARPGLPRARTAQSPRWRSARHAWATTPTWLRGALAAQGALILVLGGLWLGDGGEPPAMYRTLGDAAAPTAAADLAADHHLLVMFDPRIDQAQMQRLLRASQTRIVDGPNDAGAYVLAVPAAREAAVREALRAATGVTMVESLGPDERH